MKAYLLRNVDDELWLRVRAMAIADGVRIRALIIRLLRAYAEGRLPKNGER